MLISIIGAGYVGLVTAACLGKLGNEVRVVDRDDSRIEQLRNGQVPIHEPGLEELIHAGLAAGSISFTTSFSATHGTVLAFVAVGTLDDGEWTGANVRAAVQELTRETGAPQGVVLRSTLLPGTTAMIAREIGNRELAVNPEFTREGTAVSDFLAPDRVVIGAAEQDGRIVQLLRELYEPLGAPFVITDPTSAETIKVASNVFLAAKISFANELARVCAATGADVAQVVHGMGLDRRIGRAFLSPGPGFGGSCLPSQSRALAGLAEQLDVSAPLMASIDPSNASQAEWCASQVLGELAGGTDRRAVALLGATFKAGTDDVRESPALRLARILAAADVDVRMYDPTGATRAVAELERAGIRASAFDSAAEACRDADAVVIVTEWQAFRELDWPALALVMRGRLVLDTRNIIDTGAARTAGFNFLPAARGGS